MSGPGSRVYAVTNAVASAFAAISGVSVATWALGSRTPKLDLIMVGEQVLVEKNGAVVLGSRHGERITVICRVLSASGSGDANLRARRAADILDAAEAAILADQTLGGVCSTAVFAAESQWDPEATTEGTSVQIAFGVVTDQNHIV